MPQAAQIFERALGLSRMPCTRNAHFHEQPTSSGAFKYMTYSFFETHFGPVLAAMTLLFSLSCRARLRMASECLENSRVSS
ncbi:unnamed protein product [Periconia digitata]|uniref:Uncharacterized protein n=1 Tax=Periconia digitata TaxID=1303443 RepID=A0A9W4URP1_9PLEO|nr:unnamed protein product [Periconia digitata]